MCQMTSGKPHRVILANSAQCQWKHPSSVEVENEASSALPQATVLGQEVEWAHVNETGHISKRPLLFL